jgi:16S rRNA (guanine(1405)-N(7))-methyltransferase
MSLPESHRDEATVSVVADILQSRRYRHLAPSFVERLARQETRRAKGHADTVKRTKRRLHQVFGAYVFDLEPAAIVESLARAQPKGSEAIREICRRLMAQHSSTRERLPVLDDFYRQIFAITGAPQTVLDLACGLGPLAIPWMDLPRGARYYAYDIDRRLVDVAAGCLQVFGLEGGASLRDIVADVPEETADVALLLKSVPCLGQQDPGSGARVIAAVKAPHVVVSFPTRSLGGAGKGMTAHYRNVMHQIANGHLWTVREILFASELVYVVHKSPAATALQSARAAGAMAEAR